MLGPDLKIEEFCQTVIQPKIDASGLVPKKRAKIVLFYAGPSDEVVDELCAKHPATKPEDYDLNWRTAATEAVRIKAFRIDDSRPL